MSDLGLYIRAIAKVLLVTGIGPGAIAGFLFWKLYQVGARGLLKSQWQSSVQIKSEFSRESEPGLAPQHPERKAA